MSPSLVTQTVIDSFYVDNGLTGANSISDAKKPRSELEQLLHWEVSFYVNGS